MMTDHPHLLDRPERFAERRALLGAPAVAPLEAWRAALAATHPRLPHVDPLDGGVEARLLILLETPGAGAADIEFVSRDCATGTARNLRRFLDEAGIACELMLLWNVVPWTVHAPGARNRPLRRAEIGKGLATLPSLLALLPRLSVVVLAGRPAAAARPVIERERPGLPIIEMPHPSPTYVCTSPLVADRIRATLAAAADLLDQGRCRPPARRTPYHSARDQRGA